MMVHWACKGHEGRSGTDSALSWEKGKTLTRECLGIFSCDNPVCEVITRPLTSARARAAQAQSKCVECGSELVYEGCNVRSILYHWSGGIHYVNGGFHMHPRPTQKLHALPQEKKRFDKVVKSNPSLGPNALITGIPTFEGPGESVADISNNSQQRNQRSSKPSGSNPSLGGHH